MTGIPKFTASCAHCDHLESDATIEFNFKQRSIFFICPKCKKMNQIVFETKAYPKIKKWNL